MQLLELKAKVKPGKEKELNQVIKDLIPNFNSITNLITVVHFDEEVGELNFKFQNGDSLKKMNDLIENKDFILLLGSVKVLCNGYSLILPNNKV